MKILILILLIFLLESCSDDNVPEKEYEACLSLNSIMIKGYKSMKKIGVQDSSGFNLCCFNYKYSDTYDLFKDSKKYIDIPDILDLYKKIDIYSFMNKDISGLVDSTFKVKYLFSNDIDGLRIDAYSIRTKMDLISEIIVNQHYGIILIDSEYPIGTLELKKIDNKQFSLKTSTLMKLDSLLYENYTNSLKFQ
jgi:hypothetical protein